MSVEHNGLGWRVRLARALRHPPWHTMLAGAGVLVAVPAMAWVLQAGGHEHASGQGETPSVVTPERISAGTPLISRIEQSTSSITVLVSPMRPGWNLVRVQRSGRAEQDSHLHESVSGTDVLVGTDERDLVRARERAGATGQWARVRLPRGESRLLVSNGTAEAVPIPIDTGQGSSTPAAAVGQNGPECAAAAVGTLLGDGKEPLTSCPSDRLTERDADRIRALVRFLADRRLPGLTYVADGSPRSREAASVVRTTARAHDLAVDDDPVWAAPDQALLVLTGWEPAARQLDDVAAQQSRGDVVFGGGTYLAPWLLNPVVLDSIPNALLPLSFDIREQEAVSFSAALRSVLPGEQPTAAAYAAWRSTRHETERPDEVRLYAASRVAVMPSQPGHGPHEQGVSWFPGGTVTPVTNALPIR